jgi:phospholipid-transporting ATPase
MYFFTGIQPIAIGLFDRDCKAETRMSNPKLYISSQNGDQFNNKVFWRWILLAVFHSVILYFVPASSWFEGLVWRNGKSGDYLVIGTIVYSCVILTVNAKAFLILDSVNIWSFLAIFGCTCFWFIFLCGYSFAWPLISFSPEMAGMILLIAQTSLFWMSLLHTPLLALLPDIFGKAVSVSVNPSITDLARLGEKKNFDPLVDKLLCGTLGRKKSKESTTEMAETQYTRQSSGRGYAFSQEEYGAKSQTEVVKSYEDQPKTSIRARYDPDESGRGISRKSHQGMF